MCSRRSAGPKALTPFGHSLRINPDIYCPHLLGVTNLFLRFSLSKGAKNGAFSSAFYTHSDFLYKSYQRLSAKNCSFLLFESQIVYVFDNFQNSPHFVARGVVSISFLCSLMQSTHPCSIDPMQMLPHQCFPPQLCIRPYR